MRRAVVLEEVVHTPDSATMDESGLWDAFSPRIYRYLFRLTDHRELAEDLTQETFLQAIRHLRKADSPPPHLESWLFRIATNRATDHFRRRRLLAWLPFQAFRDGVAATDPMAMVDEQDMVSQVLRRLSPETAALLLLKDVEGFTTQEIAVIAGQSYEAARKRLARAREQFRVEYAGLKGE